MKILIQPSTLGRQSVFFRRQISDNVAWPTDKRGMRTINTILQKGFLSGGLVHQHFQTITNLPPKRWTTFDFKRFMVVSNFIWLLGLMFAGVLVYFSAQVVQVYAQRYRTATQRTESLISEIERLHALNLYTSTQAIDIARNMHRVMESGRGAQMDFLETIVPEALRLQITHGVPASATISMAIYESRYGTSKLATDHQNYFGIKAFPSSWSGATTTLPTIDSGQPTVANFRAYADPKSAVVGYAEFLRSSPRYKEAFEYRDGESFVRAILKAGYCPDPDYLGNIRIIMKRHSLAGLDLPPTTN